MNTCNRYVGFFQAEPSRNRVRIRVRLPGDLGCESWSQKNKILGLSVAKCAYLTLISFDALPACDRQIDRPPVATSRSSIAENVKNE